MLYECEERKCGAVFLPADGQSGQSKETPMAGSLPLLAGGSSDCLAWHELA